MKNIILYILNLSIQSFKKKKQIIIYYICEKKLEIYINLTIILYIFIYIYINQI